MEKREENFVTKLGEQFSYTSVKNLLKNVGQMMAGKFRWNKWVEKWSGKSLQCTVYSKVVLLCLLREP